MRFLKKLVELVDTDPNTPGVQLPRWLLWAGGGLLALALFVAGPAAFGFVYETIYSLSVKNLGVSQTAAMFNGIVAAIAPLMFSLMFLVIPRASTKAVAGTWFVAWSVLVLASLALYGVINASLVVVSVDALTVAGQITAPLLGGVMLVSLGAVLKTLTGADDELGSDNARDLIAKLCAIGFSSFGMINFAVSRGQLGPFAAFFGTVVEAMFASLVWRKRHTTGTRRMMWLFGILLGMNSAETVISLLGLDVPGAALLKSLGQTSIALSGLLVILAAVSLASSKQEREYGPSVFDRVTGGLKRAVELRDAYDDVRRVIKRPARAELPLQPVAATMASESPETAPQSLDDIHNDVETKADMEAATPGK